MRILFVSELTSSPGLDTMCMTLSMTCTIVLLNVTPVNHTLDSL